MWMFQMSIIRNEIGEVRLAWRLILVILLYIAVAVLLLATAIVFEDPVCSTAIGILYGFMGLLIVWLLVRVIEKSSFTWKTVGLDWKRNSLLLILLGAILALLLFIASILTTYILSSNSFSLISPRMDVSAPVFFQKFVLYLAMGFGEEIVFRGYVQTRLVERYRAIWGILITAVVFVLLHQISYSLSPVIILSGMMLWITIGVLYHLSKSLYLVIVFHGLMNTLMNTLDFKASDTGSMIVHAFALSLVIVVALVRSKGSGIRPNAI
jgi:membrane protease YdiL (CAAX protease family)